MQNSYFDLIIDTSRYGMAMGLYRDNEIHEHFDENARGEVAGVVLDKLLLAASTSLDDVKRVLVTLGPGSFTGLRTGIAFCQGLCFSGKRTLYGVSTLQALSSLAHIDNNAVLMKARPGYWYLRFQGQEHFCSTEEALAIITVSNSPLEIVGDSFTAEDSEIGDFIKRRGVKWTPFSGRSLSTFLKFFDELQPSLIQDANYIQPSYFEKLK